MGLSSRFTVRNEASQSLVDLLMRISFGTRGSMYKHLDTNERIKEADNPVFVSLERDGKVQGNVTFCKRGNRWYLRYFAFSNQKQASKNPALSGSGSKGYKSNSVLKEQFADFLDEVFDGKHGEAPECFYAYIDPKNDRSKGMAEQFGFQTEAQLMTQTFTRKRARNGRVVLLNEEQVAKGLAYIQKSHAYFVNSHAQKGPFYGILDEQGELVAFCKVTQANWVIERLPGMLGNLFIKLLPYTPGINKIIKPKDHHFLVPESVWVLENKAIILNELFDGILSLEKRNMLVWWVDRRESLWRETKSAINWGLVHRMTSHPVVDVVVMRKNPLKRDELRNKPIWVAGWDLV